MYQAPARERHHGENPSRAGAWYIRRACATRCRPESKTSSHRFRKAVAGPVKGLKQPEPA
jgi:hypothetical protein